MELITENWSFDELVSAFRFEHERARETCLEYCAKSDILHEMLMERYKNNDIESETVMFIEKKRDEIRMLREKFYDIQKYLDNLQNGYNFNVSRTVGRCMVKFGLTTEQAELFAAVHRNHLAAFEKWSDQWKKRIIGKIEKVEWVPEEDCFHVHYDDGEWWHYCRDGSWY
jgi:hypothetical protein